jgi:hypothetical protein
MRLNLPQLDAFHHDGERRMDRRWDADFLTLGSY